MNEAVEALFQFTRAKVTEQDIRDFSPSDPGYPDYVRLWTEILKSGIVPQENEFDLSEVINLTGWCNTEQFAENDLERFLAYRRFTTAVAVALIHNGNDCESVRPVNYLAHDLIADLDANDPKHLKLVRKVFPLTREMLASTNYENEYPFFTFGMMILAQFEKDWEASARAAALLIEDENDVRMDESLNYRVIDDRFLLGLTNYDTLHQDWIAWAQKLTNPKGDENTQLVIDAFNNLPS